MKRFWVVTLLLFILAGCAGNHMQLAEIQTVKPVKDKAEVIFLMGKSAVMTGIVVTLYDVMGAELHPISSITVGKNVRYIVDPGKKVFTAITYTFGHSGFIRANLEAGKTYYVVVNPFNTFLSDGVSLHPVKKVETSGVKFFKSHKRVVEALKNPFVEFNAKSKAVAIGDMKKATKHYLRYWAKWKGSSDDKKSAILNIKDGF